MRRTKAKVKAKKKNQENVWWNLVMISENVWLSLLIVAQGHAGTRPQIGIPPTIHTAQSGGQSDPGVRYQEKC